MKNVFKTIAIVYFAVSIVIAVASAIMYSISVSRLIKVFTEESEELDKIEISETEVL